MKLILPSLAVGLAMCLYGQMLLGLLVSSLAVIILLKILERQLQARMITGIYHNDQLNSLRERFLDGAAVFLQQFTSVFFACMFWMTQGDLSMVTQAHWQTALRTALAAAAILQFLRQHPTSILLQGRVRAFVTSSLVVSTADRVVHPGHFGGQLTEALVTGMSAYGINLAIDGIYELILTLFSL